VYLPQKPISIIIEELAKDCYLAKQLPLEAHGREVCYLRAMV